MNLFAAAHDLTRTFISEFENILDCVKYRKLFSFALKCLHIQANATKISSIAQSEFQIKRMPNLFTKTSLEIWKEQKANKFFWANQLSAIKNNLPSEIAKRKATSEDAAKYYEGRGVTMC